MKDLRRSVQEGDRCANDNVILLLLLLQTLLRVWLHKLQPDVSAVSNTCISDFIVLACYRLSTLSTVSRYTRGYGLSIVVYTLLLAKCFVALVCYNATPAYVILYFYFYCSLFHPIFSKSSFQPWTRTKWNPFYVLSLSSSSVYRTTGQTHELMKANRISIKKMHKKKNH